MVRMNGKRWGALRLPITRLLCLIFVAFIFLATMPYTSAKTDKFFLGPKNVPFCISSDYVTEVGHYTDGTPIIKLAMFLPDLAPSDVYDKLHPIPKSPIFWSPERLEYSRSILITEVTSSYNGEGDPTGTTDLMQTLNNPKPFDHPASTFPVEGFSEYDDKWGQPEIYYYNGPDPYGILCFRDSCDIDMVINNSLRISIGIGKPSIQGSLDIIERFKMLVKSMECKR